MRKKKDMSRNENAQKEQYCEEAFELYDNFEKFEYDITNKDDPRPEILRHKQASFIRKNIFRVISKTILKCTLVKNTLMKVTTNQLMTWTHNLYFLKVVPVAVATLI